MSRTHNILEIPMGDYEEPIVLNNGEDAKAFIASILNSVTYSRRWRGRGPRRRPTRKTPAARADVAPYGYPVYVPKPVVNVDG